jgi:hypothetical protein
MNTLIASIDAEFRRYRILAACCLGGCLAMQRVLLAVGLAVGALVPTWIPARAGTTRA